MLCKIISAAVPRDSLSKISFGTRVGKSPATTGRGKPSVLWIERLHGHFVIDGWCWW